MNVNTLIGQCCQKYPLIGEWLINEKVSDLMSNFIQNNIDKQQQSIENMQQRHWDQMIQQQQQQQQQQHQQTASSNGFRVC